MAVRLSQVPCGYVYTERRASSLTVCRRHGPVGPRPEVALAEVINRSRANIYGADASGNGPRPFTNFSLLHNSSVTVPATLLCSHF